MKKYTIDDLKKEHKEFIPEQMPDQQTDMWFVLNKIVELTNTNNWLSKKVGILESEVLGDA